MNVTERINRVLFIMTYVSQHPGVTVTDLAAKVGLRPRQLMKELDFILLIGKPPFRPDDYVDIYVDDDRVFIEYDQMLNRPLRFTRPEAVSLLMSLQLLDPEVEPQTVQSLKDKILKAISTSMTPQLVSQDQIVFEESSKPVSEHFSILRNAIEERSKIDIEYYSLTRNKTSARRIRPYMLTKSLGYWYLTGFCELREDQRTFKFERILAVEHVPETFDAPKDLDVERYRQNFLSLMGAKKVEIFFKKAVAPWIQERWRDDVRDAPDGGVILTLSTDSLEYPSRLVLSYAPHARVIKPLELIEKVREDAQKVVALYEGRTVG